MAHSVLTFDDFRREMRNQLGIRETPDGVSLWSADLDIDELNETISEL